MPNDLVVQLGEKLDQFQQAGDIADRRQKQPKTKGPGDGEEAGTSLAVGVGETPSRLR